MEVEENEGKEGPHDEHEEYHDAVPSDENEVGVMRRKALAGSWQEDEEENDEYSNGVE